MKIVCKMVLYYDNFNILTDYENDASIYRYVKYCDFVYCRKSARKRVQKFSKNVCVLVG